MAKARNLKNPVTTVVPSPFFHFLTLSPLSSLLKKNSRSQNLYMLQNVFLFFLSSLISFTFLGISFLRLFPISQSSSQTSLISPASSFSTTFSDALVFSASLFPTASDNEDEPTLSNSVMVPLPARSVAGNVSEEEREFWKQPNGEGYKPCLSFSFRYRKASAKISKERRKFLMVVASGGLNQQRNQIVDAVVIARILEAALVVPILQVNLIWGDER